MNELHLVRRFVQSDEVLSRRTVAGRVLAGGIAAGLLATTGRRDARAQATPDAEGAGPRRFVLKGENTDIVYAPGTAGDPASLDYRDAKTSHTFAADELSVEQSPALATMVSASIDYVADGYELTLTLLVPDVNRDEDLPEVLIKTVAILTRHLTSIGGPALVKGALQTFEVILLEGVAEFAPS